jgi:hypothetical protein
MAPVGVEDVLCEPIMGREEDPPGLEVEVGAELAL